MQRGGVRALDYLPVTNVNVEMLCGRLEVKRVEEAPTGVDSLCSGVFCLHLRARRPTEMPVLEVATLPGECSYLVAGLVQPYPERSESKGFEKFAFRFRIESQVLPAIIANSS